MKQPTEDAGRDVTVGFFQESGPGLRGFQLSVNDEMLLFHEDRASMVLPRGRHLLACAAMGAPGSYVTVHCVAEGVSRRVFDRLTIPPHLPMILAQAELEL